MIVTIINVILSIATIIILCSIEKYFLIIIRETCYRPAVKLLRQFYKRPYFIPPMVEMAESVWLFLSSDYTGKKYKPVRFNNTALLLFASLQKCLIKIFKLCSYSN